MRFFKVVSTIIIMLFSSVTYTETFDKSTIKTMIEKEFGKDYVPAIPGLTKPFPSKFYKYNLLHLEDTIKKNEASVNYWKQLEQDFYIFIENIYFLKTCSLIRNVPAKTNPIDFSQEFYKNLFISGNTSFIRNLDICSDLKTSEKCLISNMEEVTNYYTEHYKKTVKYYKLLKLLDPKGEVITGIFSCPFINTLCSIYTQEGYIKDLERFKTVTKQVEKSLLELEE